MAAVTTRSEIDYNSDNNLLGLRLTQDSDVIRYTDSSHGNMILTSLSELRNERNLTDITLQVGHEGFACHRNVLAACSPYFKAMFTCGMQVGILFLHYLLTVHSGIIAQYDEPSYIVHQDQSLLCRGVAYPASVKLSLIT